MINWIVYLSFISISFAVYHPIHGNADSWDTIQDSEIWIGHHQDSDINWCRTKSTLPFDIQKISFIVEDLENYYNIFDRVKSSKLIDSSTVHIRIDMPFPISDRDYIVRYEENKIGSTYSYKFESVKDTSTPTDEGCVRLVNAAGEWYLKSLTDSSTEVSYTWNGELGGDFPEWALTRAWKKQGTEMIEWLSESLDEIYKD